MNMWEQNSLHRGKKTTTITTSERKTFGGRKITLHISHPRHQTNICNASDASKWCAWCCVGIWVVELKCTTILIVLCAYSNANGAALDWKVQTHTHTHTASAAAAHRSHVPKCVALMLFEYPYSIHSPNPARAQIHNKCAINSNFTFYSNIKWLRLSQSYI